MAFFGREACPHSGAMGRPDLATAMGYDHLIGDELFAFVEDP